MKFAKWLMVAGAICCAASIHAEDLVAQHKSLMNQAVLKCDIAKIEKLAATPYVDINDSYLNLVLNNIDTCELESWYNTVVKLIDLGADVNGRPTEVRPIFRSLYLTHAAAYEVTRLLIERGADVTFNRPGEIPNLYFFVHSPVYTMTSSETMQLLEMTHDAGADVNATWSGMTPFLNSLANLKGDLAFTKKLVEFGANPLATTEPNHRTARDLLYLFPVGGGTCDIVKLQRAQAVEDYVTSLGAVGFTIFPVGKVTAVPCR